MKAAWTVVALALAVSAMALGDSDLPKDGTTSEGDTRHETQHGVMLMAEPVAASVPAATAEKAEPSPAAGETDAKPPETSLWYTCKHPWGNNGVAIKTPKHLLVFDHIFAPPPAPPKGPQKGLPSGGTTIGPKDLQGCNTLFFFTHDHADHYDPAVKKLATARPKGAAVHFIIPESMRGEFGDEASRRCTTALGHEQTRQIGTVKVHSAFTGQGVRGCNYIVEADGLIIVYVNRCFEGPQPPGPQEFVKRLRAVIGTRRVDVACTDAFDIPFPEASKPRLLVPVHFMQDSQEILEQDAKRTNRVRLTIGQRYTVPGDKTN